jgi:hypothetical protein
MLNSKQKMYYIISACALVFMAAFMITFASRQSFWVDEMWQISCARNKNIVDICRELFHSPYNLPLYALIAAFFYHIMPYGEVFLLIPSIAFVIAGIIILSKAGRLIGGEDIGFYTLCIAVTSSTLMTQGGWELRPYSITFCFSALTLLMFVKRLNNETKTTIAAYGISLVLLMYSHWFGTILATFYAFTDLYLYLRKKIAIKCIWSYILAVAIFLPWFLLIVIYHVPNLGSYWAGIPGYKEPILTIRYLLSSSNIYYLLFGFAFIVILIKGRHRLKNETSPVLNVWGFMIFAVVYEIAPIFVYSRFINQGGSFYVYRYFFAIMPFVFLITAYAVAEVRTIIQHEYLSNTNKKSLWYVLIPLLFCFTGFQSYRQAYSNISAIYQPYRQAAEYLAQDEQIYTKNTLVVSSNGFTIGTAWIEYYFNKRRFSIPENVAVPTGDDKLLLFISDGEYIEPRLINEDEFLKYKYLYLFEVHDTFSKSLINTIKNEYPLVEEISMPHEKGFISKFRENVLHHPPRTYQIPNLLRIYSK